MRQTGVLKAFPEGMSRKDKLQAQECYQKEIQGAGFNLVDCGSCGSTFLHRTSHEEIECPFCDYRSEQCDFPDHFHEGFSGSGENKMTDKEMLRNLFEFETYCTARFDSEVRVALAVYEYVKKMKQDTRHEITNCDVKRKLANNEVAILDYNTREMDVITIENLGEIMEEYDEDKHKATKQALRDLGYDLCDIDFMT